jgi:hypothetical protein
MFLYRFCLSLSRQKKKSFFSFDVQQCDGFRMYVYVTPVNYLFTVSGIFSMQDRIRAKILIDEINVLLSKKYLGVFTEK